MAYKTDIQLKTQVDAVIVVNGNREITPPLDNYIRTNFIDSKLNLGGGTMTGDITSSDTKGLIWASGSSVIDDGGTLTLTTLTGSDIQIDGGNSVNINANSGDVNLSGTAVVLTGTVNLASLTASTVPYLNASNNLVSSAVTPTQLSYVDATSSIQTQLNAKQATLVSGTNIKTINSTSLLGSGDIVISGSLADGDYGDVLVASSGTVWTVQSATSPDITTSITTPSTTFALVNATATTINFAAAATTLNIGNASGSTNLLGLLKVASDTDGIHFMGRGKIGTITGTDQFGISHYDNASSSGYALVTLSGGATYLNAPTSTQMYFNIGGVIKMTLDTTTLVVASGLAVTIANDQDTTTILGRAKIGSPTTDHADFAHYDHLTTTNYGVRHTSVGALSLNSASSQNLSLRINNVAMLTVTSTTITVTDAIDLAFDTTTGTKIGTATGQKISFWNKTPIIQPTTGITGSTLVSNGGTTITSTDTFGGYTLQQLAAVIRNTGLAA
jgi:hypothetical protein